jgi:Flp pilus assembly protein TadD
VEFQITGSRGSDRRAGEDLRAPAMCSDRAELKTQCSPLLFGGLMFWFLILTSGTLPAGENDKPTLPKLSEEAKSAVEKGIMEFHDEKFQEAKVEFQKITELAPAHPIGWLNLGSTEFRLGELDQAEEHLRKAVHLDPSAQQGWLTLGIIDYQKNDSDAGLAALSEAVYLNPKDPKAHLYLGILIRKRGWLSGAEDEMRKAIELDETYAEAHFNLAVLYLERQPAAFEPARRHYYRSLELGAEPDSEIDKSLQKAADGAESSQIHQPTENENR